MTDEGLGIKMVVVDVGGNDNPNRIEGGLATFHRRLKPGRGQGVTGQSLVHERVDQNPGFSVRDKKSGVGNMAGSWIAVLFRHRIVSGEKKSEKSATKNCTYMYNVFMKEVIGSLPLKESFIIIPDHISFFVPYYCLFDEEKCSRRRVFDPSKPR